MRIAEECGLIRAIDRWVLYAALKQCAIWDKADTPVPISINTVSYTHLSHHVRMVAGHGIASARVVILAWPIK